MGNSSVQITAAIGGVVAIVIALVIYPRLQSAADSYYLEYVDHCEVNGESFLRAYLVTISKWRGATADGTTGAHMRAEALRGSSTPSCRSEPEPHGTWRAMPASVPQPTGAPDAASRQRRPASPHRCVGCASDSRVRRQPHGLKDCHTLCPSTGVGVHPRWAAVVRPQRRPGSPPTTWHHERWLPQP